MHAAIKGGQYEMLEFLVKDTSKNVNKNVPKDKQVPEKYKIPFFKRTLYWKTRSNRDFTGNSPLHFCFEIINKKLRYKMFKLLVENEIGNIHERNKMGLLPQDLDHNMCIPPNQKIDL